MRESTFSPYITRGLAIGLVLFQTTSVLAHGKNDGSISGNSSGPESEQGVGVHETEYPPTYFAHSHHAGLLYTHIALMSFAWIILLPIAVVFSLVRSRYTLTSQIIFVGTNASGVIFATMYNAATPDLYPGNAHHTIGWIVTWVSSVQVTLSLLGCVTKAVKKRQSGRSYERRAFTPIPASNEDFPRSRSYTGDYRLSNDSGQGSEPNTESLRNSTTSAITHLENNGDWNEQNDDCHSFLAQRRDHEDEDGFETVVLSSEKKYSGIFNQLATLTPSRLWIYLERIYFIIDRIILPFGFIAFATGVVTLGRFFEGHAIFNGLAHWVKGGAFFWLGLFTLGRWCGSFGDLGWAWNALPKKRRQKWHPSSEFVESSLILFYGSTNIFLEHLGGWGGEWTSQDLEHLSITVLFIGGGMCGILIESSWVRDCLNTSIIEIYHVQDGSGMHEEQGHRQQPPATYEFSLNPIPALVILILGIMMSSHQQSSMISSMVHKQWGNLLIGASFARGLTYVLIFLRPPSSIFPSRPPTELISAFGLISGGIMLMASSADTIEGMIHYELDAMFFYSITMGLVSLLMAWEIAVLSIKGWAFRKEQRFRLASDFT